MVLERHLAFGASLFVAGATCEVGASLFLAGAVFGDVGTSLVMAGAVYSSVVWRFTFRSKHSM